MAKKFKCVTKTESEQGFGVSFNLVTTTNTPSAGGNLHLHNLTEVEADEYTVGAEYELKPVTV